MTIALLNTSILPAGQDRVAVATAISRELARGLIAAIGVTSHIGHAATADVATALLGAPVAMDRTPWAPETAPVALVVQLRGRPPEGAILSVLEMEAIGYDIRLMVVGSSLAAVRESISDLRRAGWAGVDASVALAATLEPPERTTAVETGWAARLNGWGGR